MSSDPSDIDPETERRMAANLLQGRRGRTVQVETKTRRLPTASQPLPKFVVSMRVENFDEIWAFDLVRGDQRVQVGREYDRQDALKLQRAIEAMGLKVEWVQE